MPAFAIYVGRPTIYGNPFAASIYGQARAVELFRNWVTGNVSAHEMSQLSFESRYSSWVTARSVLQQSLPELRGRNAVLLVPSRPAVPRRRTAGIGECLSVDHLCRPG